MVDATAGPGLGCVSWATQACQVGSPHLPPAIQLQGEARGQAGMGLRGMGPRERREKVTALLPSPALT